jgi:excisionase family DNA binding protein
MKRLPRLPLGDSFPVQILAKLLHVHRSKIFEWIDTGEISTAFDLRCPGSGRSTIRVPRSAVMKFLESRRGRMRERRASDLSRF